MRWSRWGSLTLATLAGISACSDDGTSSPESAGVATAPQALTKASQRATGDVWAKNILEMSPMGAIAAGRPPVSDDHPMNTTVGQFDPDVIGGPDTTVNGLAAVGGQAEGSISANADASVLIVGFNDARGFGTMPISLSGVVRSLDGGATWLQIPVGPGGASTLPGAAGGSIYGDPDVKFDPTRNIFVFSSIFVRPSDALQGMSIHTSNADGSVWSNPIEISPSFIATEAADKEFIDINPVTGRLHVSWTQFSASPTRILTTFTDDLGATWAPATQLVQAPMNGGVQASVPRVLPGTNNDDSTVYVVWRNSDPMTFERNVGCARSLDGGATWEPAVNLDDTNFPPEDQILGMDRVNTSPAMAIDHGTGRVYVVYQRNNTFGTGDIALRTFVGACQPGPAVMLSSNPGNDRAQFVPFISVDQSNGRTHVGWYDQDAADSGDLIETMHTQSTNQGVSWSPPTPVTDRPFHAGYGNDTSQPNLGDYNQSVAISGNLYTVWAGNTVQPLFDEGQPAASQLFTPDMYVEKTEDAQFIAPLRVADTTTSDTAFCEVSGANGRPDPGEDIEFQVKLDNYVGNPVVGATTLTGISATLSTTTPGITITGATRAYADLAPLAMGNATTPFQFSLASNFVPGTVIDFLLTVTSTQGATELPIRVNTGIDGPPAVLIDEDFSVTTIGTAVNLNGWQSVKQTNGGSPQVTHWVVSQLLTPGNNAAYHNEAAVASWIRLYSPTVTIPTPIAESRVTLDFDLVYDLEEEPSKLVEAYDGMTLRITDATTGATLRSVLAEAFAEQIKTGTKYHYPRHLVRSSNTNYLEDMSVWSGPSDGVEHVSMRFPGQGMAGRTIQVRFEFTQDGFAVCTDNGAGRGPCGIAVDNVKLNAVPIVADTCVASICGDGVLQTGEECDDGNTAAGDCCSPTCTLVAAGTVCRASAGACDVAESCTGSDGACPADVFVADGTTCDDSNACTQTDTCQTGTCTGDNPVVCDAPDQCHDVGTCNPATGICSNPNIADGTVCNDGDSCTQTDTCTNGTCNGDNPVVCTALDQCHVPGICDSATGTCSNPNITDGTGCNDGDSCTQTDLCQSGTCMGSNPIVCTASDQCHDAGTCDPTTGMCSNPNSADGTACDDADGCTQTDACQTGACAGGNPVVCTASDQCHDVGACDSTTGLCSDPVLVDGTACDDNDACTKVDACTAGTCTGTDPVVCDASDQCHDTGTCDPTTGTCSNPNSADGTACNDDNVCTVGETCQAGTCGAPQPLDCNDNNECTADTCDPKDGCVHTDGQCAPVYPAGGGCDCAMAPGSSNSHGLPSWTFSGLLALLGLNRLRRQRKSTPAR